MPRDPRLLFTAALLLGLILSPGAPTRGQEETPSHEEKVAPGTIVESPEAMKVTTVIQCFCGTCSNQTLHDCTCGVAERERRRVAAALAGGETPGSLIAAYVAEHGPQVRIVPEVSGSHLVGFSIPFAAAAAGLLGLYLVLRRWSRRGPATAAGIHAGEVDPRYRDRLARDLEALDR